MSNHYTPWTEPRLAQLKAAWAAGEKSTTIATAMGTTRNAVLGKLFRLGLIGHRQPAKGHRHKVERTTKVSLPRMSWDE